MAAFKIYIQNNLFTLTQEILCLYCIDDTHTHVHLGRMIPITHTYIYIYIYVFLKVCPCVVCLSAFQL